MKGASQGQIASVSQRCDDQAACVSKVLVAVRELGIDGSLVEIVIFQPVISKRLIESCFIFINNIRIFEKLISRIEYDKNLLEIP